MTRSALRAAAVATTLALAAYAVPSGGAAAAEDPLSVRVEGAGTRTWPAFDPAVRRYAVGTGASTGGDLEVSVTGTTGPVSVDGRTVEPTSTVSGLEPGDEVTVRVDGTSYAFVYLPPGFPDLEVTAHEPGLEPGSVALTPNKFAGDDSPTFSTILDRNAVPLWLEETGTDGAMDLKRQPDGSLTLMRPEVPGARLVTLDGRYEEVGSRRTVGLLDTDAHDSWVFPDGRTILLAYEPNDETGLVDAVVQVLSPSRQVLFQWDTSELVDESLRSLGGKDYAHVNSVWPLPGGDLVLSMRHFSSVLRIATTAHDGHQPGDVVWRLGGRDSSFTFPDAGFEGGPCAQHTASHWVDDEGREHVLLFDNGSNEFVGPICLDPADPDGDPVLRPQTRVTEYVLHPEDGTARVAWNYQVPGQSSSFAGSAFRLDGGNVLVGWAASPYALASEVSPGKELLWQVEDARAGEEGYRPYFSYRAMLVDAPDEIAPTISAVRRTPAQGPAATPYVLSCRDRGGANLQTCAAGTTTRVRVGQRFFRRVVLAATDGADNRTRVTRDFAVTGDLHRPDLGVLLDDRARGFWAFGPASGQRLPAAIGPRRTRTASFVVTNRGLSPDRFRVTARPGGTRFAVTYRVGGVVRTRALTAGTFVTPVLGPGRSVTVRATLTRRSGVPAGLTSTFPLSAVSLGDGSVRDAAALALTTR